MLKIISLFLTAFIILSCTSNRKISKPKENVFHYALIAKVPSLDPGFTTDLYSALVQSLVYESLYEYHPFRRPFEMIPLIAESLPEWSKDRKKMTIKIKKGIHFADDACFPDGKGREVVASDVVYMMERISSKKKISPLYSTFEDKVVGIKDFYEGKATNISGIKTNGPYSITFELTKSLPRFDLNFTSVSLGILPKECVEKYGDDFSHHPVGTGAYIITEANLSHKIVAVKNPNYTHQVFPNGYSFQFDGFVDPKDSGKKLPFVDKVVLDVIEESQPRWLKFLSGELDVLTIPKDNLSSALPNGQLSDDLTKRGVVLQKQPLADVTTIFFNMEDSVWGKKKELRRAFALALDVPKIIEIQYSGQAVPAHSLIDPSMYGYDAKFRSKWVERNLDLAKKLLADAGYPEGKGLPPVVLPSMAGTQDRQFDELLTKQLAQVGIVLDAEAMTWPEMMERKNKKSFVAIGMGFSSSVPDVEDMLSIVHSKYVTPGPNNANYKNPLIDKLSDEIETMDNSPNRMAKIRKLIEILDDDLPYIPLTHRIGNQLVQPWVKNNIYNDSYDIGRLMKYRKVEFGEEKNETKGQKK